MAPKRLLAVSYFRKIRFVRRVMYTYIYHFALYIKSLRMVVQWFYILSNVLKLKSKFTVLPLNILFLFRFDENKLSQAVDWAVKPQHKQTNKNYFLNRTKQTLLPEKQNQTSLTRRSLRDKHFLNNEIQWNGNARPEYKTTFIKKTRGYAKTLSVKCHQLLGKLNLGLASSWVSDIMVTWSNANSE